MNATSNYFITAILALSTLSSADRIVAQEQNIPIIDIDQVPLTDAIRNVARLMHLNLILDPRVPGSEFGPGRAVSQPRINVRWTNITAQTTPRPTA